MEKLKIALSRCVIGFNSILKNKKLNESYLNDCTNSRDSIVEAINVIEEWGGEILEREQANELLPFVSDFALTKNPTIGWFRTVHQYECSICRNDNIPENSSYCPDCGAKIEWWDD